MGQHALLCKICIIRITSRNKFREHIPEFFSRNSIVSHHPETFSEFTGSRETHIPRHRSILSRCYSDKSNVLSRTIKREFNTALSLRIIVPRRYLAILFLRAFFRIVFFLELVIMKRKNVFLHLIMIVKWSSWSIHNS